MIVFMFLFLPQCGFEIFATGKRVNHGGLKTPTNFHFCEPGKPIKLAKKIKLEKLNQTVKHYLNKCIQISYKKWPVIGRVRYREVSSGE